MRRITAAMIVAAIRKADPIINVQREPEFKLYSDLELLGLVRVRHPIEKCLTSKGPLGAFSITGMGASVCGVYTSKILARQSTKELTIGGIHGDDIVECK